MRFVHHPVLHLARVWRFLKNAKLIVRRAVPVMRGTSSAEMSALPHQSVGVSTKTATIESARFSIPMDSVKSNARVHKMER